MHRFLRRMAVVPILATAVLGAASATADAAPGAYTCTGGEVPAGTYSSLTVTGSCYVIGAVTVNGNVTVGPTGRAQFLVGYSDDGTGGTGRLTVKGSLTAKGASFVYLDCPSAGCVTVAGNVSVSQTTNYVLLNGISVGGSLTVSGNTDQGAVVGGNTIRGNLTCTGNTPAVTVTEPNAVNGRTTGQCLVRVNGS